MNIMGDQTAIQWTNRTWNPWRGCTKISPGCAKCYMFTEQTRYGQDPSVVLRTKTWKDPLKWNRSAAERGVRELVFTCSWSDWFHEDADQWREEAWGVIRSCPNLIFQILTKRPERIAGHLPRDWFDGYSNVWLGVSVENRKHGLPRIDLLRDIPARIRFLSIEPLLEDLGEIVLSGIHWVIIGGESGPGARECHTEWIAGALCDAKLFGVPVFVKQFGSYPTHGQPPSRMLLKHHKGGDIEEWPAALRVREFP